MEEKAVNLPIIDLLAPDRFSTASQIRQACSEFGFFYVVNHGLDKELLSKVFEQSKKFFTFTLEEKMKLLKKENRGYTPLYADEKLNPISRAKELKQGKLFDAPPRPKKTSTGDVKESFFIGRPDDEACNLNQWPSEELLPNWRSTMEAYCRKVMSAGKTLLSLIALALNLDDKLFENLGALDKPSAFLHLLHYPEIWGAAAHCDTGMIALLATDGVPGLQVCQDKDQQPRVWEDVPHIEGALIVIVGDMMERWTNCVFRSTLHRVIRTGQERYSAAFFFDPPEDLLVECLESCCSESNPPRYPPIRFGGY